MSTLQSVLEIKPELSTELEKSIYLNKNTCADQGAVQQAKKAKVIKT